MINIFFLYMFIFFAVIYYIIYFKNQKRNSINICHKNIKYKNYDIVPHYSETVLFTMLIDLPFSTSKVYFFSLIKVKYKGLVVVLSNNNTQKFYDDKLNINYIDISDKYPYYPLEHSKYPLDNINIHKTIPKIISQLPIFYIRNVVRYFIFYMWLKEYGSTYKYFIFSDLRDVIFQKHPFGWNICKGVILTEETKYTSLLIISPQFNILYFKNRSRMNHTVINGGLLYGSYKELTHFLHYYTDLYTKIGIAGNDQSILNYIYYEITPNVFNFPVILNEEANGYARCLASYLTATNQIPIDYTGFVVNKDGSYPTILHQYSTGIETGTQIRKKLFKVLISNLIKNDVFV